MIKELAVLPYYKPFYAVAITQTVWWVDLSARCIWVSNSTTVVDQKDCSNLWSSKSCIINKIPHKQYKKQQLQWKSNKSHVVHWTAVLPMTLKVWFDKLQNVYGIPNCLHKWFGSYLSNRHQRVRTNQLTSAWKHLVPAVPQTDNGPIAFFKRSPKSCENYAYIGLYNICTM